jgi:hypothetical protein
MKDWMLLDVNLEIIRILDFQQFHENVDPAICHLASSKPASARLEASRSLFLTENQTLYYQHLVLMPCMVWKVDILNYTMQKGTGLL